MTVLKLAVIGGALLLFAALVFAARAGVKNRQTSKGPKL